MPLESAAGAPLAPEKVIVVADGHGGNIGRLAGKYGSIAGLKISSERGPGAVQEFGSLHCPLRPSLLH